MWVISDKEDVDTLEVVWMSINKHCPDAVVSTLMTMMVSIGTHCIKV